MQQHLTRTTLDLALAPPLPGGCLLSCSSPFSAVPVHIVYIFSSNLRQSYHCTYSFKSRALPIYLCATTAPLRNLVHLVLVHPSRAPLLSCTHRMHHYPRALFSHAPLILVHLQSLSWDFPLPDHRHSCSCTSRAQLILVHLSCTTYTRAPLVLVHQSYSCTNRARAPIIKPTRCPIQEGLGPSPWQAHNIPLAIVNLLPPSAHLS